MPNLTLRGCCIGTGRPKVIIPIVERTESAILEKAAAFSTLKADCVEWRADWFDAVSDMNALAHCLHGLRAALGEFFLPAAAEYSRCCGRAYRAGRLFYDIRLSAGIDVSERPALSPPAR